MEVDINEPKSKAFNIFLRMLQLSLQLISGYWASRHQGVGACEYSVPALTSYVAYGLAGLNLVALFSIRCSKKFPKILFFIIFILDFLIALAIIALQFFKGISGCATTKVYQEFSLIEALATIIICILILAARLAYGQRYTNAPGNIVFPLMFLVYNWGPNFRIIMLIIGIGTAFVCALSFLLHLFTCVKTSTSNIKALTTGWIISIIVLVGLEILAIVKYLTAGEITDFADVQAKKTLAIFIAVNAVDILFWLWGMKTLDYEKGD